MARSRKNGLFRIAREKLGVTANGQAAGSVVAVEPNRDTSQTARSCQIGLGEWTDPDSAQNRATTPSAPASCSPTGRITRTESNRRARSADPSDHFGTVAEAAFLSSHGVTDLASS